MAKREGNNIGGLSALGEAFKGQELPVVHEQAGTVSGPTAETADTAGDLIVFLGKQYLFYGYDEHGRARLQDETGGISRKVTVTQEQLLDGFRLAQEAEARVDAGDAEDIEAAIKLGEVGAHTRVLQEVSSGTPEPIAVDNEIKRDVAAVEAVMSEADAVPLPGEGESAPETLGQEITVGAPEGELASDDRKERAKQLEKEAARALLLEGEISALRKKKGKKHEVGELYTERDQLDEHIHGVLREIAPEVLLSIHADDITRIDKMRQLFGDEKDLSARRKKEEELVAGGQIQPEDLAKYKEALKKRSGFISAVTSLGVPHHVATRLYRNEGEAIQEFQKITEKAESGDVGVLRSVKAKHLLKRFGIDDEGVQHFVEQIKGKNRGEKPGEFESFVARGNNKPVLPESLSEIEMGDVAEAVADEQEVAHAIGREKQLNKEAELIVALEENIDKLGLGAERVHFERTLAELRDKHNKFAKDEHAASAVGALVGLEELHRELESKVAVETKMAKATPETPAAAQIIETNSPTRERMGLVETKEHKVVSAGVIEAYGNEGVSFEELQTIPGFTDLSEGQQFLMLKNYSTALVGKVKREAKKEADAAWGKRSFLGKVGLSMITMGLAKNVSEQARQRDIARKLSSGDHLVATERRAMLEAFAKVAEEGPEVVKEEDGSLRMNYLAAERFKDNPEALAIIESYNAAASEYAKIPKQWIDADIAVPRDEQQSYFKKLLGRKNMILSGKEHLQVAETREAYQEARRQLLDALEKHEGKEGGLESRRAAMLELNGLDERVQLNQLFASNPDAEEALQNLRDTNIFTRSISEFAKNRGQYMAYGSVTRIAAAAVLGAVALPATAAIVGGGVAFGVAGAVGYFQARREAKELLKTRRASGMIGEAELQEDVVYTANNAEILARKEEERDAAFARNDTVSAAAIEGDIRALRERIKTHGALESRTKKLREFRDAKFYSDRVERLLTKLDVAHEMGDKESAEILERKIAQTATLMREYMQQGMLSFGQESRIKRMHTRAEGKHPVARADDARSALNSLAFMQALGHADAVHALDMSAMETKIESILEGYRKDIDASARKRSNKHIMKAVALRVGFGLAGYGLTHAVANFFGGHDTVSHGLDTHHDADWGEHGQPVWGETGNHLEQAAGLGAHTVVAGETLTAIVRKFPEVAKLPLHDQEVAIANLVKHLSPEQLKLMGIRSGDADIIRVGEHIDMNKLRGQLSAIKIHGKPIVVDAPAGATHSNMWGLPKSSAQHIPANVHAQELAPAHVTEGAHHTNTWGLPKGEAHAVPHTGETLPEIAAIAQNKMNKSIEGIFGKKGLFGGDHMREWEGDPLRRVHGLKDAPAENMLSKHQGLLSESRTRAGLRDYMQEVNKTSGVQPRTGETVEMYIKRALTEQERVSTHRALGNELIRRGERGLEEAEAMRNGPVSDETLKNFVADNTRSAAEGSKLKAAYDATGAVAEAAPRIEAVHSVDEALDKVMPKLMKFPEIANADDGVRMNIINNVLRGAKPEHYSALGISPEDGQKFLGGGHVDAYKIAEYLRVHRAGGASVASVTAAIHEAPASESVTTMVGSEQMPHLSHEDVLMMEKRWDTLSGANRAEAAEVMVPDYAKQAIAAHIKDVDPEKFMQRLDKLPIDYVLSTDRDLSKLVDPETAKQLLAVREIVASKRLYLLNESIDPRESILHYLQRAYLKKMLDGGPAAVK